FPPVGAVRAPQQTGADKHHETGKREPAAAQQHTATGGAGLFGNQHRLAENDLFEQPAEEIAAALRRPQRRGVALVNAERAGEKAGQAIKWRPFLGAGSKIKAAQERRRIESRAAKRLLQEFRERRL